jgi:hypothetical protein
MADNPFPDIEDLIGYCTLDGEFISTDPVSQPLESFYLPGYLRLVEGTGTRRINVCGAGFWDADYLGVSFSINPPTNVISIVSNLPSIISGYQDAPIQAHVLRVAPNSNKHRAESEIRVLIEMLKMDLEKLRLGDPKHPWDFTLGLQRIIAQKEAFGAIDSWNEYLIVQESITYCRLAICRYEALAEVHLFEGDDAESEIQLPIEIDGKEVFGIEGDYIVGGELQCWDERYIEIPWGSVSSAMSWISHMGFDKYVNHDFSIREFISKGSTLNAYCPGGTEIDSVEAISEITSKGVNGGFRYYLGRQTDRANRYSNEYWIEPLDEGEICDIYETREFDNSSARFPNEEPSCEVIKVGTFNLEQALDFFAHHHFAVRSVIWNLCYQLKD